MNNPVNPINLAPLLSGDPAEFGRVAEDGTVYVKVSGSERPVGSYPGKSPEEALAYFVRKFVAVASEVALLADRIKSGALVPDDAKEAVVKLRQQVIELNGVGDLAKLAAAVDSLPTLIEGGREAYEAKKALENAAKDARRAESVAAKEKLVAEAESLADSTDWKATSERLKTLLDEWKAAPRLDKSSDTALWKRFSGARNKFDKQRRTHFASLEANGAAVAAKKQELIATATSLSTSTDWVNTARRYKSLMDDWKAAGRGKHSTDTKQWEAFKAAQDAFFAAKNADLDKRSESFAENIKKREEVVVAIEALLPISDFKAARNSFNDLFEKYIKAGQVDRKARTALDSRVDAVEKQIDNLAATEARKSDATAIAHANSVVQGLIDAIETYEIQAARFEAAGNVNKAKAAREAAAARKVWLDQAQKGMSEFSN